MTLQQIVAKHLKVAEADVTDQTVIPANLQRAILTEITEQLKPDYDIKVTEKPITEDTTFQHVSINLRLRMLEIEGIL